MKKGIDKVTQVTQPKKKNSTKRYSEVCTCKNPDEYCPVIGHEFEKFLRKEGMIE